MKTDEILMRFYTRADGRGCVETISFIKSMKLEISSFGLSRQNPKDVFNPYIGRKVAAERAISKTRDKEIRKLLWEHFFMLETEGINETCRTGMVNK